MRVLRFLPFVFASILLVLSSQQVFLVIMAVVTEGRDSEID